MKLGVGLLLLWLTPAVVAWLSRPPVAPVAPVATSPHRLQTTTTTPQPHRVVWCRAAEEDLAALTKAAGGGVGKHGQKRKRHRVNKYRTQSKVAGKPDPLEAQAQISAKHAAEVAQQQRLERGRRAGAAADEAEALAKAAELEQGSGLSLDISDTEIDPYDPASFGFTNVGTVTGVHGVRGELRVSTESDFGLERLCQKGSRLHLKPPNRRFPREQAAVVKGRKLVGATGDGGTSSVFLVQLTGIHDRSAASLLKGHQLFVRAMDRQQQLENDEFLVEDLVGLRAQLVERRGGTVLGTITGVVTKDQISGSTGLGHDLLELELLPKSMRSGTAEEQRAAEEAAQKKAEEEARRSKNRRNLLYTHNPNLNEKCLIPFVPQIVPEVDAARGVIYMDPPGGLLDLAVPVDAKSKVRGLLPPSDQQPPPR